MKKSVRMTALLLAAAMTLTVMGSVVGVAADGKGTVTKAPDGTYAADDIVDTFEITVDHNANGLSNSSVTVGDSATITGGDFDTATGTLKVKSIDTTLGQQTNRVKYVLEADGLKLKSSVINASLRFTVPYKAFPGGANSGVITVSVKVGDSGGGGSTPPAADGRYSVDRVRLSKREGDKDVPGTERFNIADITGSSNANIYQTYFADITVKVSESGITAGLGISNIETDSMGSFSYVPGVSGMTTQSVDGYWEMKFTALRYSGNGRKLSFRIDDEKGYATNLSIDISECVTRQEQQAENDKNNNDDDSGTKLEVETPYVIVNKYGYGGGSVTAGETFTLSMTFQNTSEDIDISNMMITLTMPDDLMLTSSSNTFHVPELGAKKSITKAVQVTAKPAAKVQSHNVGAAMKYQYVDDRNNTRRSAETTENIAIPVVQVDRFEVTAVEIPMDIMLEEETSVTVSFVNKGRSEVYNLAASIDGNIINPGQNQNLGNLASGVTGTADFFIKPNEAGQVAGTITITYEDTNMEQKIATIPYNATVKTAEEMGGNMNGMMPGMGVGGIGDVDMPVEPEKKSVWPVVAIAAVVVLIPVGLVVKKKLDQKRKEREDADL